jgi:hypothetical protein
MVGLETTQVMPTSFNATQTVLDLKASIAYDLKKQSNSPAFTGTVTGVTSAMVGLEMRRQYK